MTLSSIPMLLVSLLVVAGAKFYPNHHQEPSHPLMKRWVDVDEDDANANNGNREKTPSVDNFSSLLGRMDQGLTDQMKSVNDISNLESVAETATAASNQDNSYQSQPTVEAGPLISGGIALNAGTGDTPIFGATEPFQEESPTARELTSVQGSILSPGSINSLFGSEEKEGLPPGIIEQMERQVASPMTETHPFDGLHEASHTGPILYSEGQASIFHPATEVTSSAPIHHFEGPISKFIGPVHKYIPGKSIYFRPIHVLHRARPFFRHLHALHRPRIIVIRRRRPRHRFVLDSPNLPVQSSIVTQLCQPTTCKNGGTCTVVDDLIKCICSKGYRGGRCEIQSLCHPDPCRNGGTCTETDRGFTCTCPMQFIGEKCDLQSYCHPNPCRNSGQCYEKTNGFDCSCATGFKGPTCTFPSFCHPNPCQNDGICSEDDQTYRCTCSRGFSGPTCEGKRLTCNANTCQNGGSCTEDGSTVSCSCTEEFRGRYCEERILRACQPNTCLFGGTCIDVNMYEFRCVCLAGRTGKRCAAMVEDPCAHCSKHAICNDDGCVCKPGYSGSGFYCEREKSNCHPNPCENGGTCIDKFYYLDANSASGTDISRALEVSTYQSSSQQDSSNQNTMMPNDLSLEQNGFNLRVFKRDGQPSEVTALSKRGDAFDDLRQFDEPAEKYRREANFEQNMTPSFQNGDLLTRRRRYDGLPSGVSKSELDFYGFACECKLRFKGLKCETPDPCNPNPCLNSGVCIDHNGVQQCKCAFPYTGQFCNNTDACRINPCKNNGKCIDVDSIAICKCRNQFEGRHCEVNRCDKCDPNARCLVESGQCRCEPGYSGDGLFCVIAAVPTVSQSKPAPNPCASNPCLNGGTCIPQPSATNNFICICAPGFTGPICTEKASFGGGNTASAPRVDSPPSKGNSPPKVPTTPSGTGQANPPMSGKGGGDMAGDDDDEKPKASLCHPNPCLNDGKCVTTSDGYTCMCSPQFTGKHCEEDKCMSCDIHALCIMGLCKCRHGYKGDGLTCEKDKKCAEDCQEFAICLEGMCICQPGYYSQEGQCHAAPPLQMIPPPQAYPVHIAVPPPPPPPPPLPPPPPPLPPVYYPPPQYMTPAIPPFPHTYPSAHPMCYDPCTLVEHACICPHASAPPPAYPGLAAAPYGRSPPSLVQQRVKELQALGVPPQLARALIRSALPKKQLSSAPRNYKEDIVISVFQHLGCFKETQYWWNSEQRSIPSVEGRYPRVSDDYRTRKDPIGKCADTAKDLGYKFFALQNGGQCFTSSTANSTYGKYGTSSACKDGIGGPLANDVYSL